MRSPILPLLAAFALSASACGGAVESPILTDGKDSGSEAAPSDAAPDKLVINETGCVTGPIPRGPGGCFMETPATGSCCNPGDTICQQGDPCCVGVWQCSPTTHTWVMEGLGCACRLEAGPPPDAPAPDTGGPVPCGTQTCAPGDICVEQTTSGGPCLAPNDAGLCPPGSTRTGDCCTFSSTSFSCKTEPAGCGGTLSCGCASSLCSCTCSGAADRTLMCACLGA